MREKSQELDSGSVVKEVWWTNKYMYTVWLQYDVHVFEKK